jgi:hypothetical protein
MPKPERRGVSARAAPWDGHPYATIAIHAQQISPGTRMTDEVELDGERYEGERVRRCEGGSVRRCERVRVIVEWKSQLHGDRIADRW